MDAGAAFYERTKDDAVLKTLLGTYDDDLARVQGGWPEDFTDEESFPLLTHILSVPGAPIRPGWKRWVLQVDIWVWPTGANGGPGRRQAIDDQLEALFDEAQWVADGVRWNALFLGSPRDAAGTGPIRRVRPIEMVGSEL